MTRIWEPASAFTSRLHHNEASPSLATSRRGGARPPPLPLLPPLHSALATEIHSHTTTEGAITTPPLFWASGASLTSPTAHAAQ